MRVFLLAVHRKAWSTQHLAVHHVHDAIVEFCIPELFWGVLGQPREVGWLPVHTYLCFFRWSTTTMILLLSILWYYYYCAVVLSCTNYRYWYIDIIIVLIVLFVFDLRSIISHLPPARYNIWRNTTITFVSPSVFPLAHPVTAAAKRIVYPYSQGCRVHRFAALCERTVDWCRSSTYEWSWRYLAIWSFIFVVGFFCQRYRLERSDFRRRPIAQYK